jgi:hypothetical protein
MTDNHLPDELLSEETRHMINEQCEQRWLEHYKAFFDQIQNVKPPTKNGLLADRVKRIATDLFLSGDEYGANVLYEAADAIRAMK